LPISPLQVLACLRLLLSQEAEIQDCVWVLCILPLKRFSQPTEVLRALFFFTSLQHVNAVNAYFYFSWAGHSAGLVPSPQ
jgi:hypothetical protein